MSFPENLAESEAPARTCLAFGPGMSLRQRRILRTALRMFAEREYAEVSLRDIAREAGVSLTLIDHHFGAKHALLAAVVQSWSAVFERAATEIRHAQAQGRIPSPTELTGLVLRPVDQLLADPDGLPVLRLWARHRHTQEATIAQPMHHATGAYRQAIEQALQRLYPAASAEERRCAAGLALSTVQELAAPPAAADEAASPCPTMPVGMRRVLRDHIEGGWRASLGAQARDDVSSRSGAAASSPG